MPHTSLYQPLNSPEQEYKQLQAARNKLSKAKRDYKDCLTKSKKLDTEYDNYYSGSTFLGLRAESFIPVLGVLMYFDYQVLKEMRDDCEVQLYTLKTELESAKDELRDLDPEYTSSDTSESDYSDNESVDNNLRASLGL